MRTFVDLQTEVLRYFDLASEPSTSADVALVKAALNTANQTRAVEDHWRFMLSGVYTFAVVTGVQSYILPHTNFRSLEYLYNQTTGKFAHAVPLRNVPLADTVVFADSASTSSRYYDLDGLSVVATQPSTADTLVVTSTASESGSLYVEGEDANGGTLTETIAVGGTSTQTFATVSYYAKTATFSGTLTLATTGGTTLVTLAATEAGKEYPVVKFYNIPTVGETMQYRYWRRPRMLTLDLDRPDLPFPLSAILVYDTLLDLATYNELDSESVNIWRDKQQKLEQNLYMEKLEADTVGGRGLEIESHGVAY